VQYSTTLVLHIGLVLWRQTSESASDLPNRKRLQPDKLCATSQAWHDHVGGTTVGRPDPKGLPTFRPCTKFYPCMEFKFMSSML
jgi:hypothetical protein